MDQAAVRAAAAGEETDRGVEGASPVSATRRAVLAVRHFEPFLADGGAGADG